MFRELAPAEIEAVSGGYDTGEIVVTGQRPGVDLWGFESSSGYVPDDYGGGVFTEGDGGGSSISAFLPASSTAAASEVGAWIRWILDKLIDAGKEIAKNESAVSNSFDPDDVQTNFYEDGKHVWVMEDGRRFVDTNSNGMPDVFYKYGNDGIVWGNQGTGWFDTGARWLEIPPAGG